MKLKNKYLIFVLFISFLFFPKLIFSADTSIIPSDRSTVWNPGLNSVGGIPSRTTICATINSSTYGNGTIDATYAIQNAINNCPTGQVVYLSAGDYLVTNAIFINKSVVLRGAGPTLTKLKMPIGTNSEVVVIGMRWYKYTQSVNLSTNAVKGSYSVTLVSNPGLQVGEVVLIDELTDPNVTEWNTKSPPGDVSRSWFSRMDRPVGQMMEVASINGNTVTFTTPFHIDFNTSFSAQLSRISQDPDGTPVPSVKYAGLEDLYVSGGGNNNISLEYASYSWVKNVESDNHIGKSISISGSFRCIVRDSYFHSTRNPYPGGGGYGIAVSSYSSDNLIENNIVWNMNKVMVMQASGGGNVIGYNYMEDGYIGGTYLVWVEVGLNASHMTTPHMELFEGNESFNFDGDNTWGNAAFITVFRNHFTGRRRSVYPLQLQEVQNRRTVGLMEGHWWYTFIANVLGTSDQSAYPYSSFTYETFSPWQDDPVGMWRLGYNPENWGAPADTKLLSTLIRDGNFDYFTNTVRWQRASQVIPNSLYLDNKPSFFGSNVWPWVDPVGTVKTYVLPARQRFDLIMANNPTPTPPPPPPSPTPTPTPTPTPSSNPTPGPLSITSVRYFPRIGQPARMNGGVIQGSNTSQTSGFVTLATISGIPQDGAWATINISNSTQFNFFRYLSPNNSFGDVAEIEFYNGATKLAGTIFGSAGSWGNLGNDYLKAFDGKTSTFFDGPNSDGNYVGIDITSTASRSVDGDLNTDHVINALDWSIMNSQWFTSNSQSDLRVDGIVNSLDFAILSSNWGRTW
jgi:hypothetical protein